MLGAHVPEAAINKDRQALPWEGNIDANDSATGPDGVLLAESETSSVKRSTNGYLRPGVGLAIAAHHRTRGQAGWLRIA